LVIGKLARINEDDHVRKVKVIIGDQTLDREGKRTESPFVLLVESEERDVSLLGSMKN